MDRVDGVQGRLERWTRKWWFFAAIVFLQLFPPYATGSYRLPDTAKVVEDVLYHSFYFSMTKLYPVFQVIPILLVAAVLLGKNRFTRVFSAYAAVGGLGVRFDPVLLRSRRDRRQRSTAYGGKCRDRALTLTCINSCAADGACVIICTRATGQLC
ncbi:MAG: hypothetical protein V1748_03340 [Actinomycetota bacterium]